MECKPVVELLVDQFLKVHYGVRCVVFDHVFGDESVKRDVRLPAEVCNVDTCPAARHKNPAYLLPHTFQKFPVVFKSRFASYSFPTLYGGEVTIR